MYHIISYALFKRVVSCDIHPLSSLSHEAKSEGSSLFIMEINEADSAKFYKNNSLGGK